MPKTLYVTSREEWRAWLEQHHRSETEIWLIYYKKQSGRQRIPYDHAAEEALCFGWIDSLVKRIDDERFAQKFTPRRRGSRWSELNKRRLQTLIRDGRMTEAGLALVDPAMVGDTKRSGESTEIPRVVKQALRTSAKAWRNFQKLTPARRRAYIRLIMVARKEETRARRVREAISLLEQSTGDVDDIPGFVKDALKANKKAWANFRSLAPSYRRHYVGWIMHAKKEETRARRLKEAVALLEKNEKLGLR